MLNTYWHRLQSSQNAPARSTGDRMQVSERFASQLVFAHDQRKTNPIAARSQRLVSLIDGRWRHKTMAMAQLRSQAGNGVEAQQTLTGSASAPLQRGFSKNT